MQTGCKSECTSAQRTRAGLTSAAVEGGQTIFRRGFLHHVASWAWKAGICTTATVAALWTLIFWRYLFPNQQQTVGRRVKVGPPQRFPRGTVDSRFNDSHNFFIVHHQYRGRWQIVALKSRCTHLGCVVRWQSDRQRFKCPCHGSAFRIDGTNYEGPAPRPLERLAIRLAEDGQLEVDTSRTFREELGQWSHPDSYVPT